MDLLLICGLMLALFLGCEAVERSHRRHRRQVLRLEGDNATWRECALTLAEQNAELSEKPSLVAQMAREKASLDAKWEQGAA